MKFLAHVKIIFIILILVSCGQTPGPENVVKVNADYKLVYPDYIIGETQVLSLTANGMREIQAGTPFLSLAACRQYNLDRIYDLYLEETEKQGTVTEFGSEAGQDEFFLLLAMIMQKEVDRISGKAEVLRPELRSLLWQINGTFHCLAQGGTMYYHLYERIPAYAEWYLLYGIADGFAVKQDISLEKIESKIRQVYDSYENNPASGQMDACIAPLVLKQVGEREWLLEKAYDFVSRYE